MLTKSGVALTFYAFYVASKQGKSGLTTTVDVYETTSGSPIVAAGSATEIGGGLYYYTLSSGSVDDSGGYVAVFKTADTSVDQQHIPALWITDTELKNLDAAVSTRSTLTAAQANAEADTALADAGLTTTVTGRIDAAISTRLAAADYTEPLDASATQSAAETGAGQALAIYTAATAADVEAVPGATWEEATADHATAGSMGLAMGNAGSAADPLTNTVPGSYEPGTAGARLGLIGAGLVRAVSPVREDGERITLDIGDSYTGSRALTWTDDDGTWPNLTDYTAALVIHGQAEIAGTITGAGTANQQITVELSTADTATLIPGDAQPFAVKVTNDPDVATLRRGLAKIRSEITAA